MGHVCENMHLSHQMSAVGITENVKGDVKKFEIWYSGREEVYVVQVERVQPFPVYTFPETLNICFLSFACLLASHRTQNLHFVSPGTNGGGEAGLAQRDPQNSHQPAETAERSVLYFVL